VLLFLGVSACSGARIEGGVFYSPKGYRVTLPAGAWRAATDGRADLELTGGGLRAGILAHATCEGKAPGRPLSVLARHLIFGLEGRRILEREAVTVAERPGARMLLEGRLDDRPVTVEAFVLKGERCVYDLVYVASPADFEAGRDEFREFVRSFSAR
jgi:hypothetical protein